MLCYAFGQKLKNHIRLHAACARPIKGKQYLVLVDSTFKQLKVVCSNSIKAAQTLEQNFCLIWDSKILSDR